jgi:hypothetical protein
MNTLTREEWQRRMEDERKIQQQDAEARIAQKKARRAQGKPN